MATKSRNSFLNSILFTLAILLLGYSVLTTASFTIFYEYIEHDSYFRTRDFTNRLVRSVYDLKSYYVDFDAENYEKKTPQEKVTAEELNNAVEQNKQFISNNIEAISQQYEYEINMLEGQKEAQGKVIQERDQKIADFLLKNQKTEEQIRKELANFNSQNYEVVKRNVQEWKSIKYYLKNKTSGETYTNLPANTDINAYIAKGVIYQEKYPKQITSRDDLNQNNINKVFMEGNLEGYFLVPQESDTYTDVYWLNANFQNHRNRLIAEGKAGIGAFLISMILLIFISRKKNEEKTILDNLTDFYIKIPMEFRLGLILFASLAFLSVLYEYGRRILEIPIPMYILFSLGCSTFMFFTLLHIRGFYNILKSGENFKTQWRGTIFYKTLDLIYDLFIFRHAVSKVVIVIGASVCFGIALVGLFVVGNGIVTLFLLACMVVYTILVVTLVFRRAIYFNEVVKGSDEIVSGNFDYTIEEKGKDEIKTLAHNFNNIRNGFKKSMESQMKSERMKTELITNVSHDLKTPLTSIINYVDLLKNKELSEEEKDGYIEILDRKAQRLKALIEDLFEAAKMSSGAVELNREKVDIVAILRQTLGEFDEKINESSLTFRANIPAEKIYLYLDGKKTWRVFENLVNNALKYSQPNTRVYIDLIETDTSVKVTIKNIANYEMDFDAEEIFERFKRGDKSRNTEGSGLGLAIAKSIVELQDGKMTIDLDGDLFKVIVEFRK